MRETQLARPLNWPLIIGFWAFVGAGLILRHILRTNELPFFSDADDAMRMVTALDLANGQDWQDNVQHRDNAPYGALMHWSRLIDAPIAGLFLLLRPLLGATWAADATAMIWPTMLALPLIVVSVALTRRLVGPDGDLPAILLPMLTIVLLVEFMPGRVDHHNVQILLTGSLALATMAGRVRMWAAVAAGLLAATSIAIGGEALLLVAVSIGLFGLFWVFDPAASAAQGRAFALALAGGTLIHFLAATPPSLYLVEACDALSITYVVATAAAAGGLLLATFIGSRLDRPWQRLTLLAALGAASAMVTAWHSPHCLGGPYAEMDPAVAELFFPTVTEAWPLWVRIVKAPATTLTIVGVPVIALGMTVWIARHEEGARRIDWLVLLAFAAAALLVATLQTRAARLCPVFAIPAGAWLIAQSRRRYLERPDLRRAALLVFGWVLFSTSLHFAATKALAVTGILKPEEANTEQGVASRTSCYQRATYAALADLPAGRVMVPMNIATAVLYFTPHWVVGTGFHRNQDGMRDNVTFFNGKEAEARTVAAARGIDYVVMCRGLPEIGRARPGAPDSIAAGSQWNWLEPLSSREDDLQVFRIEEPALP